jgi:hypothetical protein
MTNMPTTPDREGSFRSSRRGHDAMVQAIGERIDAERDWMRGIIEQRAAPGSAASAGRGCRCSILSGSGGSRGAARPLSSRPGT